jgi:hypothetical protein
MIQLKHTLVVALASVALGGLAHAGAKYPSPVVVETSYRYALGSPGTARNSVDSTQFITCNLTVYSTNVSGGCEARNASGATASCFFSNNPNLEKALMSLTADSRIFFAWTPDGTCELIQSYSGSQFEPKK